MRSDRRGARLGLALLVALSACSDDEPGVPPPAETPSCEAGVERPCYLGPGGTEGVGACQAGVETCTPSGDGFGLCIGEVRPERERCGDATDDDCDGQTSCGETVWLARWGSPRDETVAGFDADGEGNLYLTGYYREPLDFGGGALPVVNTSRDLFVAKLDPQGAHLFSLGVPSADFLTPRDLAVIDDLVVVVATVRGVIALPSEGNVGGGAGDDMLVWALSHDGQLAWYRRFGGDGNESPAAVTRGPLGEILITGWHDGALDLDGAQHDAGAENDTFVVALSPTDGAVTFSRFFEGPHDQLSRAVAADESGIYLTGHFQGAVDFGAGLHESRGGDDVFLVALSPDAATTRWSRHFGDASEDRAFALELDASGAPIVVGRFEGGIDLGGEALTSSGGAGFVAAFDQDGAHQMSRVLVAAQDGGAYDLALAADGDLIVTGYYEGLGRDQGEPLFDGGLRVPTILVQRLTAAGESIWARTLAVSQNQTAQATLRGYRRLAMMPSGQIAIAGFVEGPLDDTVEAGQADVFAALLEP